jgi:hypothetical protein
MQSTTCAANRGAVSSNSMQELAAKEGLLPTVLILQIARWQRANHVAPVGGLLGQGEGRLNPAAAIAPMRRTSVPAATGVHAPSIRCSTEELAPTRRNVRVEGETANVALLSGPHVA